MLDDPLSLDKGEALEDTQKGNSSLEPFMACVEDASREREYEEFRRGLDSKVKLETCTEFKRELNRYSAPP